MNAIEILLLIGVVYLFGSSAFLLWQAREIRTPIAKTFLSEREISVMSRRVEEPPVFRTAWDFAVPGHADPLMVSIDRDHIDIVLPGPEAIVPPAARDAVPMVDALIGDAQRQRWAVAA